MISFEGEWQRATLNIKNQSERVVRATAIKLFGAIIMSTPVGNPSIWQSKAPPGYVGGRLRGNWQCSVSSPEDSELDTIDPSGTETVSKMSEVCKDWKIGPSLFLSNNLPYAGAIEDGHSTQAPHGMVAVNVIEFQRILDEKAQEENK